MTDDDLEQRKQETWSMDEVRSTAAGDAAADPNDADAAGANGAATADGAGATSVAVERSDAADTADTTASDPGGGEAAAPTRATGETVREMALDAEAKGLAVRDLHNVNVYLYEDVYDEMVSTFKRLDAEYYAEHGDDLSKNKVFFNAVFRAGLESDDLREELELD